MDGGADVVFETSGVPGAVERAFALTARGGTVVLVGLNSAPTTLSLAPVVLREVDVRTTVAHVCGDDLPVALDVLARRDLGASMVDRVIRLEDVVEQGLRPLAAGAVDRQGPGGPSWLRWRCSAAGRMGAAMCHRLVGGRPPGAALEPDAVTRGRRARRHRRPRPRHHDLGG